MILTKQEKDHIKIWRLLKANSVKHAEGYYSFEITPKEINTKYYLPARGHNNFDNAEETIHSLENLLAMETIEYKTDLEGMAKRLAEKRAEKKKLIKEINEIDIAYSQAILKIKND